MTIARHLNLSQSSTRRTLTAVALGVGVASIGLTLSDIYGKPAIGAGSIAVGLGVTMLHLPWREYFGGPSGPSTR